MLGPLDIEFAARYEGYDDALLSVSVAKVGGGTLGREYTGRWEYLVVRNGVVVASGDDYITGMPHGHSWVARDIACLHAGGE